MAVVVRGVPVDRPAGPRPGRPGPIPGRQRPGDRGPAPPTRRASPAGGPSPLHANRPDASRDPGEAAAPRSLADLSGHALDLAALAPGAGAAAVDLSGERSRPPQAGPPGGRPGPAPGSGESPLGISAHRRGVPQTRCAGVGDLGAHDLTPTRSRAGTPPSGPTWTQFLRTTCSADSSTNTATRPDRRHSHNARPCPTLPLAVRAATGGYRYAALASQRHRCPNATDTACPMPVQPAATLTEP
jgi:hypothetical protein